MHHSLTYFLCHVLASELEARVGETSRYRLFTLTEDNYKPLGF